MKNILLSLFLVSNISFAQTYPAGGKDAEVHQYQLKINQLKEDELSILERLKVIKETENKSISDLKSKLDGIENEHKKKVKELSDLISLDKSIIAQLKEELFKLNTEKELILKSLITLNTDLKNKEDTIKSLGTKIEVLRKDLKDAENMVGIENEKWKNEISKIQQDFKSQIDELKLKHKKSIDDLIQSKDREANDIIQKYNESKSKFERDEKTYLDDARNRLDKIKLDFETQEKQVKDSQLSKLETLKKEFDENEKKYKDKLSSQKEEETKLSEERQKKMAMLKQNNVDIEAKHNEISKLISDLEKNYAELQDKEKTLSAAVKNLEMQKIKQEAEIESMKAEEIAYKIRQQMR